MSSSHSFGVVNFVTVILIFDFITNLLQTSCVLIMIFLRRGEEALHDFSDIKTVTLKLPQLENLSFKTNSTKQYAAPVTPQLPADDCHVQKMMNHAV